MESHSVQQQRRKRIIFTVVAVALAAILLTIFVGRAGNLLELRALLLRSASRNPGFLISGMALFSVSLTCGLTRWYILLRTLKLPITYGETLRLYATGHFFNVLGPGATGGDLVKAAWVARKCPGQRTSAITSIATERLIGLVAMVCFLTVIATIRNDFFEQSRLLSGFRSCIYLVFTVTVTFMVLLIAIDWGRLISRIHPRSGGVVDKLLSTVRRIWETFHICLTHPIAALSTFSLSIINHITDVCCYYLLSQALSMTLAFRDLLVISPIANTIAAVPITPGGAGVRENTLQFMMDVIKIPRAESTALGLLMFGTILFWAGISGIIMVTGTRMRRTPHDDATTPK